MRYTGLAALLLVTALAGFVPARSAEAQGSVTFGELRANNVAARQGIAYAALGAAGLAAVDPRTSTVRAQPPPGGTGSVDDVAVADGFLFALDAAPPGFLSVFSLADPLAPALVSVPVGVPVGPFSGVSAAGGRVVVSGGTSLLTVRTYDANGQLGAAATIDLGLGQPDVLLAPDGSRAFVSTDFDGTRFGITALALRQPPLAPVVLGRLSLPGAGFTPGVLGPANFPIESVLVGTTLLVAFGRGLAVVDASNPGNLRLVRVIELGVNTLSVDAAGSRVVVVGSSPQPTLAVLDLTNPASPVVVSTSPLTAGSRPTGIAADGLLEFIAAGPGGLLVRDWTGGVQEGCQFVLGFRALRDAIPHVVGDCLADERHSPESGDTLQATTRGLLVWQKAGNRTAFTDGFRTWVAGPFGIQERLNAERFEWER